MRIFMNGFIWHDCAQIESVSARELQAFHSEVALGQNKMASFVATAVFISPCLLAWAWHKRHPSHKTRVFMRTNRHLASVRRLAYMGTKLSSVPGLS